MKRGCRIETRQLETAARLERYLAIDSVVAWRVLEACRTSIDVRK
ncbi:MAG: hypothetical protein U1F76_15460 [Candidatus Competibacteraceae bacterium]